MRSAFNISRFRSAVSRWYSRHGRDLPWRRTRDPYTILVSEFMLQQTQVATVIPYYEAWLRRFPDFHALAAASESEVLQAWEGLGYYSRARNLHATARKISRDHGGRCPNRVDELMALPGIGRYTAHAVLTFAGDKSVGLVEANIGRLTARVFNVTAPIDSAAGRETIWKHATALVPSKKSGRIQFRSNGSRRDRLSSAESAMQCLPRSSHSAAPRSTSSSRRKPRPAQVKLSEQHSLFRARPGVAAICQGTLARDVDAPGTQDCPRAGKSSLPLNLSLHSPQGNARSLSRLKG